MGYCLNKNDKGYKQLDKEFGTTATEMLVRVYNRYTPQFVYPSVAQAHKFFKDFFKNQVSVIEAALDFDLNISQPQLENLLRGMIFKSGENYILAKEPHLQNIMKGFSKKYPSRITVQGNVVYLRKSPEKQKSLEDKIFNPIPYDSSLSELVELVKDKQIDQRPLRSGLIIMLDKLKEKFKIPYELNYDLNKKATIRNGIVYVNPNLATLDSPFHEYLHPFIEILKTSNPSIYALLKTNAMLTTDKEGNSIYDRVKATYPHYGENDLMDEVIVESAGLAAIGELIDNTPVNKTFLDYLKMFMDFITSKFNLNKNYFDLNSPFYSIVNAFLDDNFIHDFRFNATQKDYDQLATPKEVLDSLTANLYKDESGKVMIEGEEYSRVYRDLRNAGIAMRSVHDKILKPYYKTSKNYNPNAPESEAAKIAKDLGTDIHSIIDLLFSTFLDGNSLKKDFPEYEEVEATIYNIISQENLSDLKAPQFTEDILKNYISTLYDYVYDLVIFYEKEYGPDVQFFIEQKVKNKENTMGGTIDLLIVGNNKYSIYDWKSLGIKKLRAEDLGMPLLKEGAYELQMNAYAAMIKSLMPDLIFDKAVAVPIGASIFYDRDEKRILIPENLEILPFNELSDDVLLSPIVIKSVNQESPLDKFISKLKIYASQLRKGEFLKKNTSDYVIKANHAAIRKIISQLQKTTERNFLFDRIDILIFKAQELIASDDKNKKDALYDISAELNIYKGLGVYFEDDMNLNEEFAMRIAYLDVNIQKTLKNLDDAINNELAEEAKGMNINNLLASEKGYKGFFKKYFKSISTITDIKTVAFFYALVKKYGNIAITNKQKIFKKLTEHHEKLGKNLKDEYEFFFQKDEKGNKTNKLIYKFNNKKISDAIEELISKTPASQTIDYSDMFDFDEEKYNKALEAKKNYIAGVIFIKTLRKTELNKIRASFESLALANEWSPEVTEQNIKLHVESEVNRLNEKYREDSINDFIVKNTKFFEKDLEGNNKHINKQYFSLKNEALYYSSDFINLSKNPERLNLYNTIISTNKKAANLGLIKNPYTFYPAELSSKKEKLLSGNTSVLNFSELFQSLDPDNVTASLDTKIKVDELTGETYREIKKLFQNNYSKKNADGTLDYSDYSFDLIKVYGKFSSYLEDYESRQQLEDRGSFLVALEKGKRNLIVNKEGQTVPLTSAGDIIENTANENVNVEILQKFVDYYVYGVTDRTDVNWEFKIGKRKFNGLRILSGMMALRSNITLGLNVTSATSTLFGGMSNFFVESSRNGIFNKKDYTSSYALAAKLPFKNKEALLSFGLVNHIDPLIDNLEEYRTNLLSFSKLDSIVSTESLYVLLRNADKATQFTTAIAVLKNYAIEDGKLIKLSDKIKQQLNYEQLYSTYGNNSEFEKLSELDKQYQKSLEEAKLTDSIYANNIKADGNYTEFTDDIKNQIRPIIKKVNKQILGNASHDDVTLAKMTILGQLALQFKNWMPQLIAQRFGSAEMDSDTLALNWGKYRVLGNLLQKDALQMISGVLGKMNSSTFTRLEEEYNKKLQDYIENNGDPNDFITFTEFKDLYINSIKSTLQEILIIVSLMSLIAALGIMFKDSDDDSLSGPQKYTLRILNKIQNELSFYINPMSLTELVNKPIPVISVLTDSMQFLKHLSKEGINQTQDLFTGTEEKDLNNAKPLKYFFKLFPVSKEMITWMAIIDDDFRKEWDIKIQY